MKNGLQIHTTATLPKLNNGQKGLLKLINQRVKDNTPCSFEDVVKCYAKFVRKTYYREKRKYYTVPHGNGLSIRNVHEGYDEYDVYQCFLDQNPTWTYHLRAMIKQWFISTIGNLVLKGQLIVLPIIDIEQ